MGRKIRKFGTGLFLAITAVFTAAPLLFLLTGTFMGNAEAGELLAPIFLKEGYAAWRVLPQYPTFRNVVGLLMDAPEFFQMFWNTMELTTAVLLGQLLFAVPGAWGLARYHFWGRKAIYYIYIVLMMMPFQVMMLSEYLVLEQIGVNNTLWALILPGIFQAFPVFLIHRFFAEIPEQVLEAARVDGAGEMQIFLHIGIPLGKSGVLSALILQFLECISMLEQPIAFLRDKTKWPLSMYLPEIDASDTGFALCASFVAILPALFVFWDGKDYLEQGIAASALKE